MNFDKFAYDNCEISEEWNWRSEYENLLILSRLYSWNWLNYESTVVVNNEQTIVK